MNREELKNILADRLKAVPAVCAAILHGSSVKGTMRPDSDIDIAILPMPGSSISGDAKLAIGGELESVTGRLVDIGVLSTNNLVYAREAVTNGELLFTRNAFLSEIFISTCLAMYLDLQYERREVLNAYTA